MVLAWSTGPGRRLGCQRRDGRASPRSDSTASAAFRAARWAAESVAMSLCRSRSTVLASARRAAASVSLSLSAGSAVLHHRAERGHGLPWIQRLRAKRGERLRPVDGFRDAGRLEEIGPAQDLDGGGYLLGEPGGRRRHPQPNNIHLSGEVGMFKPMVVAAALERVVDVPGAVAGDHDRRRDGCPDHAQLRHRHRVVAQHLQEEGFELAGPSQNSGRCSRSAR